MSDIDEVAAFAGRLAEICTQIHDGAHTIPVRVLHEGRAQTLFLSEMPGDLAVREAMKLVIRCVNSHLTDRTIENIARPPAAPITDFDRATLLDLCNSLQDASRYVVRANIDGKGYRNVALAEMPASLAVWWVTHLIKSRLVPFEITPAPDPAPGAV